jgi:hypothetical protein
MGVFTLKKEFYRSCLRSFTEVVLENGEVCGELSKPGLYTCGLCTGHLILDNLGKPWITLENFKYP